VFIKQISSAVKKANSISLPQYLNADNPIKSPFTVKLLHQ
jgi:hypothetical protein